jgi:hypothetical protein
MTMVQPAAVAMRAAVSLVTMPPVPHCVPAEVVSAASCVMSSTTGMRRAEGSRCVWGRGGAAAGEWGQAAQCVLQNGWARQNPKCSPCRPALRTRAREPKQPLHAPAPLSRKPRAPPKPDLGVCGVQAVHVGGEEQVVGLHQGGHLRGGGREAGRWVEGAHAWSDGNAGAWAVGAMRQLAYTAGKHPRSGEQRQPRRSPSSSPTRAERVSLSPKRSSCTATVSCG